MSSRPPLIETILHSFLGSFFKVLGLFCAFIPLLILFGIALNLEEEKPDSDFSVNVVANHEGKRENLKKAATILEIDISGFIGGEQLNKTRFEQMLIESRERDLEENPIEAILLTINTPGGSAIDSDTIYRLVQAYKARYQVPVHAFVDGMCASGGMYIACSADKISATPSSVIGSVGVVIGPFFNFSKPLGDWGVLSKTLTAGKDKDPMNPFRPWKEGEAKNLELVLENFYDEFISIVAENRPQLSKQKLTETLGARIYPAKLAQQEGYIDQVVLSRGEALKTLAEEANLDLNTYQVVKLSKDNLFASLFKSDFSLLHGKVEHRLNFGTEVPKELQGQILYLFQP